MSSLDIESFQIHFLTERVKALEDKVFQKTKKSETTRAQQMLLLKHSGLLELINSFDIPKKSKALFLSILLNRSAENIEDDLTNILSDKSPLYNKKNYEFILDTFGECGLTQQQEMIESTLKKIEKKG